MLREERPSSQSFKDMTKLISSCLSNPVVNVQLAYAKECKCAGVEHRIADADYDVVQDSGDEAEKHEGDSESYHDYSVFKD